MAEQTPYLPFTEGTKRGLEGSDGTEAPPAKRAGNAASDLFIPESGLITKSEDIKTYYNPVTPGFGQHGLPVTTLIAQSPVLSKQNNPYACTDMVGLICSQVLTGLTNMCL